jgi:hypothetical protein
MAVDIPARLVTIVSDNINELEKNGIPRTDDNNAGASFGVTYRTRGHLADGALYPVVAPCLYDLDDGNHQLGWMQFMGKVMGMQNL